MPPPVRDRRTEILDHALCLFSERGLASVSTRDLADRAGLARSHVYHYFKDWQSLRQEAFARFAHHELEDARAALTALSGRGALRAFAEGWLRATADPSAALWVDAWVESLRDPGLAAAYSEAMQQWIALLENALRQAGVPHDDALARQVFGLINGYTLTAALEPGSGQAQQVSELLNAIDRLIAGAAGAAATGKRRRASPAV